MSENINSVRQSDEMDVFEILSTLWQEKLLIIVVTILMSLIGLGYVLFATPKYAVVVDFRINSSLPVSNVANVIDSTLNELPEGWIKANNQNRISLVTEKIEKISSYEKEFADIKRLVSDYVLIKANSDVEIILNELPATLQSTEAVAVQMLNAKETIRALNKDKAVISFSAPIVSKISPKKTLIITLFAVLGALLGSISVLVKSFFKKTKI